MLKNQDQHRDVRIWRDVDGTLKANVRHLAHHSPSGFECGYGGSGPADLALSILEAFVPAAGGDSSETLYKGQRCSRFAWAHHQAFKGEVIAKLSREGGALRAADILTWIKGREAGIIEEH